MDPNLLIQWVLYILSDPKQRLEVDVQASGSVVKHKNTIFSNIPVLLDPSIHLVIFALLSQDFIGDWVHTPNYQHPGPAPSVSSTFQKSHWKKVTFKLIREAYKLQKWLKTEFLSILGLKLKLSLYRCLIPILKFCCSDLRFYKATASPKNVSPVVTSSGVIEMTVFIQ